MSTLETFLKNADRLVFHMIDGSIVDIRMDSVKDIQEDNGFYGFYMNTGTIISLPDKNISWMEVELKHEPEKASDDFGIL